MHITLSRKYMPAGRRGRKVVPRPAVEGPARGHKEAGTAPARTNGPRSGSGGVDRIAPSQWRQDNQEIFKRLLSRSFHFTMKVNITASLHRVLDQCEPRADPERAAAR